MTAPNSSSSTKHSEAERIIGLVLLSFHPPVSLLGLEIQPSFIGFENISISSIMIPQRPHGGCGSRRRARPPAGKFVGTSYIEGGDCYQRTWVPIMQQDCNRQNRIQMMVTKLNGISGSYDSVSSLWSSTMANCAGRYENTRHHLWGHCFGLTITCIGYQDYSWMQDFANMGKLLTSLFHNPKKWISLNAMDQHAARYATTTTTVGCCFPLLDQKLPHIVLHGSRGLPG